MMKLPRLLSFAARVARMGVIALVLSMTIASATEAAPSGTLGACCLADGTCELGTIDSCGESGGVFQGDDTTCDPNPCPQPPPSGACCFADGSCLQLIGVDCATQSGSYEGDGTDCFPNPCPQPKGACCFADGSCLVLTSADCSSEGGV